jgi:hypothetical protein
VFGSSTASGPRKYWRLTIDTVASTLPSYIHVPRLIVTFTRMVERLGFVPRTQKLPSGDRLPETNGSRSIYCRSPLEESWPNRRRPSSEDRERPLGSGNCGSEGKRTIYYRLLTPLSANSRHSTSQYIRPKAVVPAPSNACRIIDSRTDAMCAFTITFYAADGDFRLIG